MYFGIKIHFNPCCCTLSNLRICFIARPTLDSPETFQLYTLNIGCWDSIELMLVPCWQLLNLRQLSQVNKVVQTISVRMILFHRFWKPHKQCLFVVFFTAGVFCAIVSHPADTIVSKLNNDAGSNFVDAAKALGLRGNWLKFLWQSIILLDLTSKQVCEIYHNTALTKKVVS